MTTAAAVNDRPMVVRTRLRESVPMTSVAASSVSPWTARLPWVLLAITVLFVAAMVPLSLGNERIFDTVFYGLIALALATMRAFIATQQPGKVSLWLREGSR